MSNSFFETKSRAEEAAFNVERARRGVDAARAAVDAARAAVDTAREIETAAKGRFDDILTTAEGQGIARKVLKRIAEEGVALLLAEGLLPVAPFADMAEFDGRIETGGKVRAPRARKTADVADPVEVVSAAVVAAPEAILDATAIAAAPEPVPAMTEGHAAEEFAAALTRTPETIVVGMDEPAPDAVSSPPFSLRDDDVPVAAAELPPANHVPAEAVAAAPVAAVKSAFPAFSVRPPTPSFLKKPMDVGLKSSPP